MQSQAILISQYNSMINKNQPLLDFSMGNSNIQIIAIDLHYTPTQGLIASKYMQQMQHDYLLICSERSLSGQPWPYCVQLDLEAKLNALCLILGMCMIQMDLDYFFREDLEYCYTLTATACDRNETFKHTTQPKQFRGKGICITTALKPKSKKSIKKETKTNRNTTTLSM